MEPTPQLIQQLRGPARATRRQAARRLGATADRSAVAPLADALAADDPELAVEAARALATLGFREAIVPLMVALARRDDRVCLEAAGALATLGSPGGLAVLMSALGGDDTEGRSFALSALALLDERAPRALEPGGLSSQADAPPACPPARR